MKRACLTLIAVTTLQAAQTARAADMSADVRAWLSSAGDGDSTSVIVQYADGSSPSAIPDLRVVRPFGKDYRRLSMSSAQVQAKRLRRLASDPRVASISADRVVRVMESAPAYSQIQLASGASEAIRQSAMTGSGIGVAVLDSGRWGHSDLTGQTTKSINLVAVGPNNLSNTISDKYGHGTLVAGIVLGTGQSSTTCGANYTGIAKGASLINVRVLDDLGQGKLSDVLEGINWVLANQNMYKIRVVNMSLGMPAVESYKTDPLCQATKKLSQAGIVTVVSAGNYGRAADGSVAYGSITSPGNSPWVITVGATNDHGTPARSDDTVASYSSRGPTRSFDPVAGKFDHLLKPDLVAPGNHVAGPEARWNWIVTNYSSFHLELDDAKSSGRYMYLHGTSMAAPVVSGVVAQMLQANPSLTPSQVKAILRYTAQTLPGFSVFEQGSGEVNAEGAVRLALALKYAPLSSQTPGTVLLKPSQMPAPVSSLSGQSVPWSRGYFLLPRANSGRTDLVQAGGVMFSEGVLFAEGIMVARGVRLSECAIESQGVIFAERGGLIAGRVISAGILPALDSRGYLNASSVLFAEGAALGNGDLFDPSGALVSQGVLFAEGVIFAERTATAVRLIFVGQSALQSENYFSQGVLFAETMLPSLFASPNNVLVAGEAFTY